MKIFNKCLKKQINSNFILDNAYLNSSSLNKLSLIKRTFARKIGRPTFNDGEASSESVFEEKIEIKNFQAPPRIRVENKSNDFEESSSNRLDVDNAFERERDFKQKKRGNFQNDNSSELGENQNPRGFKREFNGERENRGFRGDREFKNKSFDDNGNNNFREKRNFDRPKFDRPNFDRPNFDRPNFESNNIIYSILNGILFC